MILLYNGEVREIGHSGFVECRIIRELHISMQLAEQGTMLYPVIIEYVTQNIDRFDQIPEGRKALLESLAEYVKGRIKNSDTVRLVFICTHNSRRSHLAQIWAHTAATYYGIPRIETYSGGTEATAFNPRAVAALERAGFSISTSEQSANPIYLVRYNNEMAPTEAFSKQYSQEPNPKDGFCAVMTCSEADQGCPVVLGADQRFAIPYVDPKESDGTDHETKTYDERCRQICSEMFYVFSLVNADTVENDNRRPT